LLRDAVAVTRQTGQTIGNNPATRTDLGFLLAAATEQVGQVRALAT
jgi:hypothetical protein